MNLESELGWEVVRSLADEAVFKATGHHLKDLEIAVLYGSWQRKGYEEIAESLNLSVTYITRDIGSNLWKQISEGLGVSVSKTNFREPMKRIWEQQSLSPPSASRVELRVPDGSIELDSPFYMERPPIEAECYKRVLQPSSLIRIRSPRRMGKTSLFNRILAQASNNRCATVRINLQQAEKSKFANIDTFLRWLCTNVSRQLQQEPQLDNYWDEDIGSIVSSTVYVEEHLLKMLEQTDHNLVLGLDEIDWIFHYPEVAPELLALLRSWHEEANAKPIWKRLRLVIAHSTEIYISLNIDRSPFNVGLPIQLPEFNQQQVERLAQLHGLNWINSEAIEDLMAMIGGHPYLVRVALYHLACQADTLDHFLQEAPTHAGVYQEHLRGQLSDLRRQPDLLEALRVVVTANDLVQLECRQGYQLESMGLVKFDKNRVKPRCELYQRYFADQLS
jgi:hypothetical protein